MREWGVSPQQLGAWTQKHQAELRRKSKPHLTKESYHLEMEAGHDHKWIMENYQPPEGKGWRSLGGFQRGYRNRKKR